MPAPSPRCPSQLAATSALVALSLFASACDRPAHGATRSTLGAALDAQNKVFQPAAPVVVPAPVASAVPAIAPGLAPLEPAAANDPRAAILALPVHGHRDAVVSIPVGATTPRPIVIAAHGRTDRPDPLCFAMRAAVRDRGWVVCPRGSVVEQRGVQASDPHAQFTYDDATSLIAEIDASVRALRERFDAYVDHGAITYVGFSLGAYLGVAVVRRDPKLFRRALFIEGGHDPWNTGASQAFAKEGGERVFFACGTSICDNAAHDAIDALTGAGVLTRLLYAQGSGHVYAGPVGEEIADAFDALVEEDPRWDER